MSHVLPCMYENEIKKNILNNTNHLDTFESVKCETSSLNYQ